ncbi:hypothetical protein TSOC_003075 [Tetrabaena socialis]|uniref:Uncharacterized protein n=1 Tax=Tetrabaena socialis TaxID=47790 RepID=A0A2J8ACH2_9CHLO|nr:hypothetical protein TSOC_003075 [Tetrabaena socialis]|eukprot:PNH10203.1 hypothetical protein TSOC_003075 [Tetrabaena socialis]
MARGSAAAPAGPLTSLEEAWGHATRLLGAAAPRLAAELASGSAAFAAELLRVLPPLVLAPTGSRADEQGLL